MPSVTNPMWLTLENATIGLRSSWARHTIAPYRIEITPARARSQYMSIAAWQAAMDMYWLLALAGAISILYGAIVCLAQDDLKPMVAFSSVSHMGFVTLGIAAGVYGFTISGRGAVLGLTGAIFQMFAHGLVSAALFMVAGSLGHKIGTRNISELGGIAKRAPRMATFMMISFLASLRLPGL